jgi:hypothetical protein
MTIQDFAQKVTENIESPEYRFDPTIILIIIEVIASLMENCNEDDPEKIFGMAEKPRLIHRVLLRRHTRKVCGSKLYREVGPDICKGFIKTTKDSTLEEFSQAFSEVR